jgi:hypothetical protein
MRKRGRGLEIFSVSFLDIISCGFGAVVLLILISNNAENPSSVDTSIARQLLSQVLAAEIVTEALADAVEGERAKKRAAVERQEQATSESVAGAERLRKARAEKDALASTLSSLSQIQQSLEKIEIVESTPSVKDEEVGGIPVDSDYVIFIVDTSGSMKTIWSRVVSELENVIRIHPEVKGLQILNDNGDYLLSGYEGRWIPDTSGRRANAIDLLNTWGSFSNSSPVEGLEVALRSYANPNTKLSVYVFGDDYSGSTYDSVIDTLEDLNTGRAGRQLARVHAVGFMTAPDSERFATLMREVTRRNNGTFLSLPP